MRFKIFSFLKNKIRYKSACRFPMSVTIKTGSVFEGNNMLNSNTTFKGEMGRFSYIGMNSNICARIGRFTSIGPGVHTQPARHPYRAPFASTSPTFYSTSQWHKRNGSFATEQLFKEYSYADELNHLDVIIGNDCWICQGAFLNGGILIGDGAIILPNATVTKDVPAYAIVGGTPAKVISYRYDEESIEFLIRTKWWDKDPKWLKENWRVLSDIDKLKVLLSGTNN